MKNLIKSIAILSLLVISVYNLNAQNYEINGAKSWLGWEGKKVTGKHNGTITIKSGTISNNNNNIKGNFVIDMNSIICEDIKDKDMNAKLINHLKSDDFFSVTNHPTSTFELTKMEPYNDKWGATHIVYGKLTIKGITNEINFPAQVKFGDKDFNASAEFSIDRSKWNVRYGSGSFFDNLGDKVIYDNIKFNVNLVGVKK